MKYKIVSYLFLIILAAGSVMADADVENLILSREGDKTVLKIAVSEEVTPKSFAVEAADGKPYRIIVDLSQAVHRLTMKNYMSLPQTAIKAIRTSQFSADPDRIVRIVLDMKQTVSYEVKARSDYVYIYIKDPGAGYFLTWNSAAVKPPVLAGNNEKANSGNTPQKSAKPVEKNVTKPKPQEKADSMPINSPFKKDYLGAKPVYAGSTDKKKETPPVKSKPVKPAAEKKASPYTGGSALAPVLSVNTNKAKKPETEPKQESIIRNNDNNVDWSQWTYDRPEWSNDLDKEIALAKRFWHPAPPVKAEPKVEVAQKPIPKSEFAQAEVKKIDEKTPVPSPMKKIKDQPAKPKKNDEKILTQAPQKIPGPPANKNNVQPPVPMPKPQANPIKVAAVIPQDTNPQQSNPEFDDPRHRTRRPAALPNQAPQTPPPAKPQLAVNTPVDTLLEETPGSVDTSTVADASQDGPKPTSRFRRQPVFPAKLKGTIVAEFPTRMVIQYNPKASRDPFATLIDDTKKSDSPIARKIPDIETSRLVGVLESSSGERRALLEDLDGYGYIVKTGDKVKKGYVGKISADKAYFRLFEYGWSRTVALYLSQN